MSKTQPKYWEFRVKKRTYKDGDRVIECEEYSINIQYRGRREWFPLHTADRSAAAEAAKERYVHILANGWAATLAKYKPAVEVADREGKTIGEWIATVEDLGCLESDTLDVYASALRAVVGDAYQVPRRTRGDDDSWADRVERIKLGRIDAKRIQKWMGAKIAQVGKESGGNPQSIASAKRSVNSRVKCAAALWSRKVLDQVGSGTNPFAGIRFFESGSVRYVSRINVQAIVAAARNELKPQDPEAWKAFLLGLFGGMRRGEIDGLEWPMVDLVGGMVKLAETEVMRLKTDGSSRDIPLDPEVCEELRQLMGPDAGRYVIKSERRHADANNYRCQETFDRLIAWLRGKGVTAQKPLHELRKEIGSLIATSSGIYAASRFLGHSSIATTEKHYAAHRERIHTGIGGLLATEIKVAEKEQIVVDANKLM